MIKVSIVMPIYNAAKYLEKSLNSILSQTLKEIEIICIDDGSKDNSLEVLNNFHHRDDRVIVLSQNNQGAGIARNNGLKLATGKYVIFLDADDYFDAQLIDKLVRKAEAIDSDITICKAWGMHAPNKKVPMNYNNGVFKKYAEKPCVPEEIPKDIFTSFSVEPWNKLYRLDFLKKSQLEFQNLRRTNDLYFTTISLTKAQRIALVNEELVYYRVDNRFKEHTKLQESQLNFLDALKAIRDKMEKDGTLKLFSYAFYKLAAEIIFYNYSLRMTQAVRKELATCILSRAFQDLQVTERTLAKQELLISLQYRLLQYPDLHFLQNLIYKMYKAKEYYLKNDLSILLKKLVNYN